jgi:hypothetical protein
MSAESKQAKYSTKVVYERRDCFDEHSGGFGMERVGVLIDDRVFWTGQIVYPNTTREAAQFSDAQTLAEDIATALKGK